MMKKLLSILLCLCLVLSSLSAAAAPQNSEETTGAEESTEETNIAEITEETVAETAVTVTDLTLRGAYSVKVRGQLPEGAVLSVEDKSEPAPQPQKAPFKAPAKAPARSDSGKKDGENTADAKSGSDTVRIYDLKLMLDGKVIQPDGTVRITFEEVPVYENGCIYVMHILDSPDAIRAGKGTAVHNSEVTADFPEEAGITYETTGEADTVYVERFSLSEGTVGIDEEGHPYVDTDSFSTYYVVSGDTANGQAEKDVIYIEDGDNGNVYYVAPGTVMRMRRGRGNTDALAIYAKKGSGSIGSSIVATAESWTVFIVLPVSAGPITISTSYNGNSNLIYNPITVTIPDTAQIGERYDLVTKTATNQNEVTVSFVVMSEEDIIEHILTDNNYPVYVSLLRNSASIPGEPSLSAADAVYYSGTSLSTATTTFASSGNGIIASGIYDNPNFEHAIDGTNTMGVVDSSGVNTKAVISGIDWSSYLSSIVSYNTTVLTAYKIKGSDGTVITNANKSNYEIIPYVVKLQTAYGIGWHIDCYVKAKSAIEVSYNANIPSGYIAQNITVPDTVSGLPNLSVSPGKLAQNGTNINVNGTVTAVNAAGVSYSLTFLGWNTKSDGSGTRYLPGTSASFSESTELFAEWQSNITVGTLVIRKQVQAAEGSLPAPANDSFSFTVSFPTTSGARTYAVYNAAGVQQSSGSISSGGTLSLKAGEWGRIDDVPVGAYQVSEAAKEYYSASAAGASGTIRGGATSEAEYTNIYNKKSYPVRYDWGSDVPDGVALPTDTGSYGDISEVTPDTVYSAGYIAYKGNYIYTFSGWSGGTVLNDEIVFTGSWAKAPKYSLSYSWTGLYPLSAVLPADTNYYNTEALALAALAANPADVTEGGYRYSFNAWTAGSADESTHIIPVQGSWSRTPLTGCLKISKTGGTAGEAYIFRVESTSLDDTAHAAVSRRVCVPNGGSVILSGLPTGSYSVTEDTGWSWRYQAQNRSVSVTEGTAAEAAELTITNTKTNNKWLSGGTAVQNIGQ